MENLTEKELQILKDKANKYDEIEAQMWSFYDMDSNDEPDLADIGEFIAIYFGCI